MRRSLYVFGLLLGILCVVVFIVPRSSKAITYGFVDSNNTYSNTGSFIVKTSSGQIFPICSGTLITPNVFLTASHCTSYFTSTLAPEGDTAFVSFDGSIPFGSLTSNKTKLIPVSFVVTNPNYNQSQSDSGDIGVLILAPAVRGITPANLTQCGLLDQLVAQNGLKTGSFHQRRLRSPESSRWQWRSILSGFESDSPHVLLLSFNSLNGGYLRLSQNASTGNGGTCFGDSGGPNFFTVNGQQTLAAITITGDSVCRSTNVDYRLDTAAAQGFFAYVNAAFGTQIPIVC